jgi:hypothetical protein
VLALWLPRVEMTQPHRAPFSEPVLGPAGE